MSEEVKQQILKLRKRGHTAKEIAELTNTSISSVCLYLRKLRGF